MAIRANTCRLVKPATTLRGKQGFSYFRGISSRTAGSQGICMMLLEIPPGGRAAAHMHETQETAIYMLSGEVDVWYGDELREHVRHGPGEFLYIPAGCPHLPANLSDKPAVCVIARTDASEQESVVLLPDLERRVPELAGTSAA